MQNEKGHSVLGRIQNFGLPVLLLTLIFILHPRYAHADTGPQATLCAHGGNSEDTACVNSKNGEKYTSGQVQWSDNNLDINNGYGTTNSTIRFITNNIWMYTSTDERYSVEFGQSYGTCLGVYGQGTNTNVCPGAPSGYHAYRYWADTRPDLAGGLPYQYVHFVNWWTRNSGTLHTYNLNRQTGNICNWNVYFDNMVVGTSTIQYCPGGYSYGYEDQVGIEFDDNGNVNWPYSDTNIFSNNETWHDGQWHSWEYKRTYVTSPCQSSSDSNCFNGTDYGSIHDWYVNRPRS